MKRLSTTGEPDKTKRYKLMREQVVDVAARLFAENGYASTGVADIGDAAGLARGALYYYIGSKEELLAEIHGRVMVPLLAMGEEIRALDAGFDVRLRLLSETLLSQVINRPEHVRVFLHDYHHLEGERRSQFRQQRQRFESIVADLLREGQASGDIAVDDVRLATLAFLNLHNYTYTWWSERETLGLAELSSLYCGIYLNGVGTKRFDDAPHTPELARLRLQLIDLWRQSGEERDDGGTLKGWRLSTAPESVGGPVD